MAITPLRSSCLSRLTSSDREMPGRPRSISLNRVLPQRPSRAGSAASTARRGSRCPAPPGSTGRTHACRPWSRDRGRAVSPFPGLVAARPAGAQWRHGDGHHHHHEPSVTLEHRREAELVAWADELGAEIAPFAADHDRDGTFVTEAFSCCARRATWPSPCPTSSAATAPRIREVAMAQRQLARSCGSTALASSMHQHVTLFTAWRYRRGLPGAEGTLRRIADEGIVLVSTGGADFTHPRGTAVAVEGGFRVTGHKVFASQVPVGDVFSTMFVHDDDGTPVVLNMAVPSAPTASPCSTTGTRWACAAPAATTSTSTTSSCPTERVLARRPYGVLDPPLQVIVSIAMPRDHRPSTSAWPRPPGRRRRPGRRHGRGRRPGDPAPDRRHGQPPAGHVVGPRRRPAHGRRRRRTVDDDVADVMAAKREIAIGGIEVCDLAMEVAGGAGYFKTSVIERCYRDIRGAKFHPFCPEQTLVHAGRVALGLPADAM